MLENGFEIGNANVTTPQSIQTASAQLGKSLQTFQAVNTEVVLSIVLTNY